MSEPVVYIPVVHTSRPIAKRSHNSLVWASYALLILDIAFLIWGIVRLVFIATPGLQFSVVKFIVNFMAFTREAYIDYTFEAIQKLFLLPPVVVFRLPDVVLNGFVTALIFVIVFVVYKLIQKKATE